MITYLRLLLVFAFYNPSAHAWGNFGHQTTGEIAERFLSPEAQTAITDILGPERIAQAATWADTVREDAEFEDFKPYHYINIPALITETKNSLTVLTKYPEILKDPEASRSVKMVALRYLIHIVGDVHQPFHVGDSVDAGGNFCKVIWNTGEITNLHSVWDGKIIEYDISILKKGLSPLKTYGHRNYADDILSRHPLNPLERDAIMKSNVDDWIKESLELRAVIYPAFPSLDYCSKGSTQLPTFSEEYKKRSALITEKRILYSGLRLAEILNQIFKGGTNPGKNISMSKLEVIEKLNLKNN